MSFRIKQLIILAAILGFILFVSHGEYYVDTDLSVIYEEISSDNSLGEMIPFDANDIKKNFGFNINDYGEAFYYGHMSIMDCECLLVIKLYNEENASYVIEAIDDKREQLKKLFQSYAPEQYEMLSKSILTNKGQYIIYTVSENPEAIEKSFIESITG